MSPIERYAMRFVEETGDSWTAEQLRHAEAEIEQQKREWEANRLATIKKEEEEMQKNEEEENDILTFSAEDAKNQVNFRDKKPINKRLVNVKNSFKTKSVLGKRKITNKMKSKRRKISPTKKKILPTTRATIAAKKKVKIIATANAKLNKNKRGGKLNSNPSSPTRKTPVRAASAAQQSAAAAARKLLIIAAAKAAQANKDESEENSDDGTNTNSNTEEDGGEDENEENSGEDDDEEEKETEGVAEANMVKTHNSEDFDSECSLDVMVDSNDAPDSDSNQANVNDTSEALTVETNHNTQTGTSRGVSNASGGGISGKTNNGSTDKKTPSENHVDVNSPRTRSRGSVKINLWTLDVSPILPGLRPVKNNTVTPTTTGSSIAKQSSTAMSSSNDVDLINSKKDETENLIVKDINLDNELLNSNNVDDNDEESEASSTIERPKMATPTTTVQNKLKKTRKIVNNGSKTNGPLDTWLTKSPKVLLTRLENDTSINKEYMRTTRRTSVIKINTENGPS